MCRLRWSWECQRSHCSPPRTWCRGRMIRGCSQSLQSPVLNRLRCAKVVTCLHHLAHVGIGIRRARARWLRAVLLIDAVGVAAVGVAPCVVYFGVLMCVRWDGRYVCSQQCLQAANVDSIRERDRFVPDIHPSCLPACVGTISTQPCCRAIMATCAYACLPQTRNNWTTTTPASSRRSCCCQRRYWSLGRSGHVCAVPPVA